ncbi:hypothetical protein [Lactiplantibacillus modestisalitolerans]|uniref:Uncharacterized protein n=1 Tax=Lactiplantibacillus modestisalitolerans TaxID=1457219 RepID=A0ABV5WRP6_9LACO|nr:hypothetical protein [Lactiplantibacillus modestisalitolerans]
MRAKIVPALPTERAQYEQYYRLGLAAVTTAINTLRAQQRLATQRPLNWFPQFTVVCAAVAPQRQLAALRRAVRALPVSPTAVTIQANAVRLTFALPVDQQTTGWQLTEGAVWRLYDGLLNNLVGTAFQPVTAIQVGLTVSEPDQSGSQATQRLSFRNYGTTVPTDCQWSVMPTPCVAVSQVES